MKSTPTQCNSVMLIEDNEVDNYISEKILKSSGFTNNVLTHTSVKSALEFLKNLESLKEPPAVLIPDYILLDLNLPILDGFHFLEEFETFSDPIKSQIKIVILTCSLNPSDLERAKKYKYVVDYFSKPLSTEDLLKLQMIGIAECCNAEN